MKATVKPIVVFTTIGSLDDAQRLAKAIVERRLAACAQLSPIESYYVWKGSLHHDPEIRIVFKTTDANYSAIEKAIVELHPYDLPAIHAVDMSAVYAPFAKWIVDGTSAPERRGRTPGD